MKSITEVHAHLSGSLPRHWIKSKAVELGLHEKHRHVLDIEAPKLDQCFQIFPVIHEILHLGGDVVLQEAVRVVIEHFYETGVRYLELRTTPKGHSFEEKLAHMELLVAEQARVTAELPDLHFAWIISINREKGLSDAQENLQVALHERLLGTHVRGVDLCGNPTVSNFMEYRSVFAEARGKGLKVTIHTAEVAAPGTEEETNHILDFAPDRLGHAAILTEVQIERILALRIPVEVCLSSNIISGIVTDIASHPVEMWLKHGHPFCLCTDDISLFSNSLRLEWDMLQEAFKLTNEDIERHVANSRHLCF